MKAIITQIAIATSLIGCSHLAYVPHDQREVIVESIHVEKQLEQAQTQAEIQKVQLEQIQQLLEVKENKKVNQKIDGWKLHFNTMTELYMQVESVYCKGEVLPDSIVLQEQFISFSCDDGREFSIKL